MNSIWNLQTWTEIAERKPSWAALPIGACEQHGPHLPITTDTLIAGIIAQSVCEKFAGLLLPPITITCSHEHARFAGSISISPATLILVVRDIIASLEAHGVGLTVLLNCHGGNYVLNNVAQELNVSRPRVLVCPAQRHWQNARAHAGLETPYHEDMHAGEAETSILLHAMPEVVRTSQIQDCPVAERPLLTVFGMQHYTQSGTVGSPSRATAEKGRLLLERMTEVIGDDIRHVLSMHPAFVGSHDT